MKKRGMLLAAGLLALSLTCSALAEEEEALPILGQDLETVYEMGEEAQLDELILRVEKLETCPAEDEHYTELYIWLTAQNLDARDYTVRGNLTASLLYMENYPFEADIDSFRFPDDESKSVTDYILDPLCEMIVVLHAQVPNAVVEREGDLQMDVSSEGETVEFILDPSLAEEAQEENVSVEIPAEAETFHGHTYALLYGKDLQIESWRTAEEYCASLGGHLATLTTKAENSAVLRFLNEVWGYQDAFFGFSDDASEGDWVWVTGEESHFTNWKDGEPNGDSNENYAQFGDRNSGGWNDSSFDRNYFICEWDFAE